MEIMNNPVTKNFCYFSVTVKGIENQPGNKSNKNKVNLLGFFIYTTKRIFLRTFKYYIIFVTKWHNKQYINKLAVTKCLFSVTFLLPFYKNIA
jgi:hypothetical protein